MTAIVTTQFRVLNAENFKEDVADANSSVYVGIGKADAWSFNTSDITDTTPFLPEDHTDDLAEAYQNMIGMKRINENDISQVVPRYTWGAGNSYVPWDSRDQDIYDKQFYVLTSEFKVYKCIRAGSGASSIQPVQTLTTPQLESDGYIWKYMYTLSVADAEKFLTISYMPVKTIPLDFVDDNAAQAALSEADFAQYLNQKASRDSATVKGIERIIVTDGGTGYTSAPTVTITGDGTGATATATVNNGEIVSVTVTAKGTNYNIADITFSGGGGQGSGAARAVLAPPSGHGVDPVAELGGFFTAVNTQLIGNENGDLVIDNDFRQVTLIKNPIEFGTNDIATAPTLRATRFLEFQSGDITAYQVDEVIVGQTSDARAYIVEIDAQAGRVYYYQNSKTGYKDFEGSEQVLGQFSNNTAQLKATDFKGNPEVQRGSGDILFLENRDPINRTAQQIEDIKIIIEF